MKAGQTIHWLKDDKAPLASPNTPLVSAWLTCGGQLLSECGFSDTIEAVDGEQKRTVTWMIDGDFSVEFPDFRETVDFEEFRRRWNDVEWFKANTEHPIAYLVQFSSNLRKLRDWLKQQKPAVLVKRGNRTAVIPADCTEARKKQILAEL